VWPDFIIHVYKDERILDGKTGTTCIAQIFSGGWQLEINQIGSISRKLAVCWGKTGERIPLIFDKWR
jgi:hypothetical protein